MVNFFISYFLLNASKFLNGAFEFRFGCKVLYVWSQVFFFFFCHFSLTIISSRYSKRLKREKSFSKHSNDTRLKNKKRHQWYYEIPHQTRV